MDQDQPEQPPSCPGCGGTTASALTQTLEYHVQDHNRSGQPIFILIVYKCPCGQAFTHRVQFQPPTSADSLPDTQ